MFTDQHFLVTKVFSGTLVPSDVHDNPYLYNLRLFFVARRWLWISWAWGCCRPAARWQTSWQKASPVRDGHNFCFLKKHSFWDVCGYGVCTPVSDFCSCGGHQQETRASAQPGVHLPDYTHWKGVPGLWLFFTVCLQRRFCSRTVDVKHLRVFKHTVADC